MRRAATDAPSSDRPDPQAVAGPLLLWYAVAARSLPWRGIGDPYRIWVSEIMLQQTRVETVKRYYAPFLRRFPCVEALALAPQEEVLAAWSGLGFYRRARNLHAAAKRVVADHDSVLPRDPAALGALPGVGRYTLGAIASFAWNDPLPILDGNVIRVLSRLFVLEGDPKRAANQRRLWRLAEDVLPAGRAGDFNQALMDLGATVCTPSSPGCARCPLRSLCRAHEEGRAEDLPEPSRKTKLLFQRRACLVVRTARGLLLLGQRPSDALLADLWEPPGLQLRDDESAEQGCRRLLAKLGLEGEPEERGCSEHRFSHRHWSSTVFGLTLSAGGGLTAAEPGGDDRLWQRLRWVALDELEELGLPTASRKALDLAI